MPSEQELLPCPFCGNDGSGSIEHALHVAFNEHDWRDSSWAVQCDKCTATMGYSDSEDEAIAAWNTRATLSNQMDGDKALVLGQVDKLAAVARMVVEASDLAGFSGPLGDAARDALATPAPDKALMPEAAVGENGSTVDLLTKAVGDITAALMLAGQEDRIEAWTRPYVQAINLADLTTPTPVKERENAATGDLLVVEDDKGFITLHEPDEDGGPGDLVASVWRDDWLGRLRGITATNAGQVEDWTGGRAYPEMLDAIAQYWAEWEEDRAGRGVYTAEELAENGGEFATGLADHLASTNGQANGEGK